jgi:hypothetical protein
MRSSTSIFPPHPLLIVTSGMECELPDWGGEVNVVSTPTAIAVGIKPAVDGASTIVLSDQLPEGEVEFDGHLELRAPGIGVFDTEWTQLLWTYWTAPRARVRIVVVDTVVRDHIEVVVSSA